MGNAVCYPASRRKNEKINDVINTCLQNFPPPPSSSSSFLEFIVDQHSSSNAVQWVDFAIKNQIMIKDVSLGDDPHLFSDIDLMTELEDHIYIYLKPKIPPDTLILIFNVISDQGDTFQKMIDCSEMSFTEIKEQLEINKTMFQHKFSILFKCKDDVNNSNAICISYNDNEQVVIGWANKVVVTKKAIEQQPFSSLSSESSLESESTKPSSSATELEEKDIIYSIKHVPIIVKGPIKEEYPPSLLICSPENSNSNNNSAIEIRNWIRGSKIDIIYKNE